MLVRFHYLSDHAYPDRFSCSRRNGRSKISPAWRTFPRKKRVACLTLPLTLLLLPFRVVGLVICAWLATLLLQPEALVAGPVHVARRRLWIKKGIPPAMSSTSRLCYVASKSRLTIYNRSMDSHLLTTCSLHPRSSSRVLNVHFRRLGIHLQRDACHSSTRTEKLRHGAENVLSIFHKPRMSTPSVLCQRERAAIQLRVDSKLSIHLLTQSQSLYACTIWHKHAYMQALL